MQSLEIAARERLATEIRQNRRYGKSPQLQYHRKPPIPERKQPYNF